MAKKKNLNLYLWKGEGVKIKQIKNDYPTDQTDEENLLAFLYAIKSMPAAYNWDELTKRLEGKRFPTDKYQARYMFWQIVDGMIQEMENKISKQKENKK